MAPTQSTLLMIVLGASIGALLFAVGLARVQGRAKTVMVEFCESLAEVMFKFVAIVMAFAPFGIGAAILLGDLCLSWADQLLMSSGMPAVDLMRAKGIYDEMRTELMAGQYLDLLEQSTRRAGTVLCVGLDPDPAALPPRFATHAGIGEWVRLVVEAASEHAAAFDERFKVAVFSEGGIGLTFSNWDAPWYLGPRIRQPGFAREHHELLALIAGEDRLMPHFHLSVQSGDDMILKRMKRRHARADTIRFCETVRRSGVRNSATGALRNAILICVAWRASALPVHR